MTLDHMREIALIQISQAQRTPIIMTLIDTTLYADGALRLSRHGAGKGGDVLAHTATGKQLELPDNNEAAAIIADELANGYEPVAIFNEVARRYRLALFALQRTP